VAGHGGWSTVDRALHGSMSHGPSLAFSIEK
jgi:hypothetical protein